MKLGVSSYSFSKHIKATGCDLVEVCRLAKEIGFEAIEFINITTPDPLATARELREYCASIGLEIAAYTIGADLLNGEEEEILKKLYDFVDTAEALGAPLMRHDVTYSLPEGTTWEDAIPVLAPRIRKVTEYAKAKGIRTCSENHGYIFQDSERVEALIKAVDNPNYGWLVDVGNFLCADCDVVRAVSTAAPYTYHVHVKDFLMKSGAFDKPEGFFDTRGGNYLRGTILGHGEVPVATAIKALKRAGYDGYVSLEFEGMEENIPALTAGLAYMKKVIA